MELDCIDIVALTADIDSVADLAGRAGRNYLAVVAEHIDFAQQEVVEEHGPARRTGSVVAVHTAAVHAEIAPPDNCIVPEVVTVDCFDTLADRSLDLRSAWCIETSSRLPEEEHVAPAAMLEHLAEEVRRFQVPGLCSMEYMPVHLALSKKVGCM